MSKQTAALVNKRQRSGRRPRRLPQRTCVACRATAAKRELVRVVRTVDGRVEVDSTGKRAGRGAYLCRRPACWEEALRKDRLSYALRSRLTEADREALRAQGGSIPGLLSTADHLNSKDEITE